MKNYLFTLTACFTLILAISCCKTDDGGGTTTEPTCEWCIAHYNDGTNCRNQFGEFCDGELTYFKSGNAFDLYGILYDLYPDATLQCYQTQDEALGCVEYFYSRYFYQTEHQLGEERIIGQYCPDNSEEVDVDINQAKLELAQELNLPYSEIIILANLRCLESE